MQSINLHQKNDEFKATPEELNRIREKMDDPEFMKLWVDYMKDLQDPKYRKEEEEYLAQVEKEARDGGDHSFEFIFPKPNFVVELKENVPSNKPVFINMCESDKVDEFHEEKTGNREGAHWYVPVSCGKSREEKFQSKPCTVFDAVFHPKTLQLANSSDRFMCFVVEIAVEQINAGYQNSYGFGFSRISGTSAVGTPQNQTVKKQGKEKSPFAKDPSLPVSLGPIKVQQEPNAPPTAEKKVKPEPEPVKGRTPKHTVAHRGQIDLTEAWNWKSSDKRIGVPSQLVVKITVPEISKASEMDVDIKEDSGAISFVATKGNYDGLISLPFRVEEDPVEAKFDKTKKELTLVLSVIPPTAPPAAALPEDDANIETIVEDLTRKGEPKASVVSASKKPEAATTEAPTQPEANCAAPDTPIEEEQTKVQPIPSSAVEQTDATPKEKSEESDSPASAAARRQRELRAKLDAVRKEREEFEKKEQEELAVAQKAREDAERLMNEVKEAQQREREAKEAIDRAAKETRELEEANRPPTPPPHVAEPAEEDISFPEEEKPAPKEEAKPKEEDAPEMIDLRDRQREWMNSVKSDQSKQEAVTFDFDDPELEAPDPQEVAAKEEENRRLKQAEKDASTQREADRLEAELALKRKELPLGCGLIFAIE